MKRQQILETIQSILVNNLDIHVKISEESLITDLDADSMTLMGLVMEIENAFDVYLGDFGEEPPKKIKEMIDYVVQQKK